MIQLTETVLFHCDCLNERYQECSTAKDNHAGVGRVVGWIDKVTSSVPPHILLSTHRPTGSSQHAKSFSIKSAATDFLNQGRRATPASSTRSSSRPATPMEIGPPASDTQEFAPFVEDNDEMGRQLIDSASKPRQSHMVSLITHYSSRLTELITPVNPHRILPRLLAAAQSWTSQKLHLPHLGRSLT